MTTPSKEGRANLKPGMFANGFSIGKVLLEGRAFLALIVIIVVFSALSPDYFTLNNVLTMSSHVSIYALLAIGSLLVILNGGIDLSVGSTLGLSGVIAGFMMKGINFKALGITLFPSVWVVVIIACAVGALVGVVNGVLVSRFKVAPFIATLGTLYAVRGVALLITNGLTYNDLAGKPELGNTGFDWLGFNTLIGIPIGVLVMIVVAVVASIALNRTVFGRWLYASGGNERAADLSGVPVKKVKIWVYVASGVCAAIAGVILSSELTSASPTAGTTYELTAIAAVVIGGASLMGGKGNIRGTLLGAFVIGFLSDGLVIVGVSSYWQTVFTGAVIILAVLLNAVQYRARRKKLPAGGNPPTSSSGLESPKSAPPLEKIPG
ncbi:ABC transporter permease [Rathayibacter soli]|uniref:ABC transporter permease n=1 Tax=Rathayibacter soli TaxID=3144168 RepID=UPI0027E3C6BC|nr:ABC transporter permease [Glaciibacter superstes]